MPAMLDTQTKYPPIHTLHCSTCVVSLPCTLSLLESKCQIWKAEVSAHIAKIYTCAICPQMGFWSCVQEMWTLEYLAWFLQDCLVCFSFAWAQTVFAWVLDIVANGCSNLPSPISFPGFFLLQEKVSFLCDGGAVERFLHISRVGRCYSGYFLIPHYLPLPQ